VLTSFILKNKSKQKEISYCQPNSEKICRTFDDGEKKEIHKSASRHIPNVQHQLEIKNSENTAKLVYKKLGIIKLSAITNNFSPIFNPKSMFSKLTNHTVTMILMIIMNKFGSKLFVLTEFACFNSMRLHNKIIRHDGLDMK
jgi:hypothetical protein